MAGAAKKGLERCYKDFLRVCELWPIDPSRPGRDYAFSMRSYLEKRFIDQTIEPAEAKRAVDALLKISTNHYKDMYPRTKEVTYTNLSAEDYRKVMSNEGQSQVEPKKTLIETIFGVKKLAEREREINEAKK